MRKRILSVFLALVMTLTLLPTAAWADEETGGNYEAGGIDETGEFQGDGENGENSGDVTGAAGNFVPGGEDGGSDGPLDPVRLDPVEITYTGPEDWYTPEKLLEGYFTQRFLGEDYESGVYGASGDLLDDIAYDAYYGLKEKVEAVAGNGGSTVFTFEEVTAELADLGGDSGTALNVLADKYTDAISCLLGDCPFILYWYRKSAGSRVEVTDGSISEGTETSAPTVTATVTVSMSVGSDYQAGGNQYKVDADKATRADEAARTAREIAVNYQQEDFNEAIALEMMRGFQKEICERVTYDQDSADNSGTTTKNDPWQMISVFDNDPKTNVVCEGYSKAFKFLCDYNRIECYLVSGEMNGGGHMWNTVVIEGKSYLVDITNTDNWGGDNHDPDKLFLVGGDPTSGSLEEGDLVYTFDGVTYRYYGAGEEGHTDQYEQWRGYPEALLLSTTDYPNKDSGGATTGPEGLDHVSFTANPEPSAGPNNFSYLVPTVPVEYLPDTTKTSEEITTFTAQLYNSGGELLTLSGDQRVDWSLRCDDHPEVLDGNIFLKPVGNGATATLIVKSGFGKTVAGGDYLIYVDMACGGKTYSSGIRVFRAMNKIVYIGDITGPSTVTVTENGKTTEGTFSALVYSQYGDLLTNYRPGWEINGLTGDKPSIDQDTGVMSISKDTAGGSVTLRAYWQNTDSSFNPTDKVYSNPLTVTVNPLPLAGITGVPEGTVTICYGDVDITSLENIRFEPELGRTYEKSSDTNIATIYATSSIDGFTLYGAGLGTATITIEREVPGYRKNTVSFEVKVVAKPLAGDGSNGVTIENIPDQGFTGSAVTPDVVITHGSKTLVKGTDYTLAYENNTAAGTGKVTITGTGNYTGTVTREFQISKGAVTDTPSTIASVGPFPASDEKTLEQLTALVQEANKTLTAGGVVFDAVWSPKEGQELNPRGDTYTFVAKLTNSEYSYGGGQVITTVTVTPVKATYGTPFGVTVKYTDADGKALTAIPGLPKSIPVTYDPAVTSDGVRIDSWTEVSGRVADAVAALKANPGAGNQTVTLKPTVTGLPNWATPANQPPELTLTITGKDVAIVTISGADNKTYDGTEVTITTSATKSDGTVLGASIVSIITKDGDSFAGKPKAAGTYTVTATYSDDNYRGTASKTFTISPKEVGLTWTVPTTDELVYDGSPKTVSAAVTAGDLAAGDTCGVVYKPGSHTGTKAGSYTAEVTGLSNPNYVLSGAAVKTQVFAIAKAAQTVTLSVSPTLLKPGALTGRVTVTVTGDSSAPVTLSLSDAATGAFTLDQTARTVTATGNGTAKLKAAVAATENYQAAESAEVAITAYAKPLTAVTGVTSDDAGAQLAAVLSKDGLKIAVSGIMAKGKAITGITATVADGLEAAYDKTNPKAPVLKVTTADAEKTEICTYPVDVTAVQETDVKAVPAETSASVGQTILPDVTPQVNEAVQSPANKLENIIPAIAVKLVETTKAEVAKLPDPPAPTQTVTAEVSLNIAAVSIETTAEAASYTIDVTPEYKVVVKEEDQPDVVVSDKKPVPNNWITIPVTVSVKLPADITAALNGAGGSKTLFAKHTKSGGGTEYLATTLSEGNTVASWQMGSFSEVELYVKTKKTVTVTFPDGTSQTYGEVNRLDNLPATPSGRPWVITVGGKDVEVKKVADLLENSNISSGATVTAVEKPAPSNPSTPTPTPTPTPAPTPTPGGGSGGSGSSGSSSSSGGGSGSGSSSPATVTSKSTGNGFVSFNATNAKKGDTVTITPRPKEGYELDSLKVLDSKGQEVQVTLGADGKYSFVMPEGKVSVEAGFRRAEGKKPETGGLPFADAEASWARDAIAWAYERGYINGVSAGSFNPDGNITRQQMWMILARMDGVQPGNMAEARTWAVNNAVSDGANGPRAMSRQQLVTFLYRYAQGKGLALTGAADLTQFPDSASAAAYAQEALAWAVANGIVSGTSGGLLNPEGTATRAQFTVILQRFCQNVAEA